MWPGAGEDGLFPDDDNLPPMPRWLNVNLPRVNGAAGGPGIGRLGGAMGMVGDAALGGPRQAVEVRCLTYLAPLVCSQPPSDEMPGMQLPSKLQSVGQGRLRWPAVCPFCCPAQTCCRTPVTVTDVLSAARLYCEED